MNLLYESILEIKYVLQENEEIKIDTVDSATTTITQEDKIACVDNIIRITNKNGRICVINTEYIIRAYKVEAWL